MTTDRLSAYTGPVGSILVWVLNLYQSGSACSICTHLDMLLSRSSANDLSPSKLVQIGCKKIASLFSRPNSPDSMSTVLGLFANVVPAFHLIILESLVLIPILSVLNV